MDADTTTGAIRIIYSELVEMDAAIQRHNTSDLKSDSFNRLLTRIEQAIKDEKASWDETVNDLRRRQE